MENSIRRDVATVLVRFAGVFFVYWAFRQMIALVAAICMAFSMPAVRVATGQEPSMFDLLMIVKTQLFLHGSLVILYLALAVYLLRGGKRLVNFLAKVRESERSL
jgi:hypothetical protein